MAETRATPLNPQTKQKSTNENKNGGSPERRTSIGVKLSPFPNPQSWQHSKMTVEELRRKSMPTSTDTDESLLSAPPSPTPRPSSNPTASTNPSAGMHIMVAHTDKKLDQRDEDGSAVIQSTPIRSSRSIRRDSGLAPTTTSGASNSDGGASKSLRELTIEDEIMSIKLRSLYNSGMSGNKADSLIESIKGGTVVYGVDDVRISTFSKTSESSVRASALAVKGESSSKGNTSQSPGASGVNTDVAEESDEDKEARGEYEFAGGAEDWEDVNGSDVDRYGFIKPKCNPSRRGSVSASKTLKSFGHQRVSTSLFLKSSQPRKRARGALSHHRHLHKLASPFSSNPAQEMLTNPVGLSMEKIKEREQNRSDKWREMAGAAKAIRQSSSAATGGGMFFEFMTEDSKLISRTWKGIPDCWRAVAWHSFLTASAKKKGGCLDDSELIEIYHILLQRSSADDSQIDLDVPRTISSHIMFRRRYRGGQRLLFRVLHALSLHFPEIGYVQGMAALAATLLCYYDEDTAFIMLVRLFELRGLARIYKAGFGGLLDALSELETKWLHGTPVLRKMLRVWDVLMLLGDPYENYGTPVDEDSKSYDGILDVIHAASCGLINGMSEIILKSDFENAMKNLTSWIPIKDEDLFMRVVKTEWKKRRKQNAKQSRKIAASRPGSSVGH